MDVTIRTLRADEIEVRVLQTTEKGCVLLLYKDARCDMKILDETFGVYGWQRKHTTINDRLYCSVFIQNPTTKEWIEKQDVGVESYTEKEKGEASDSFKRANVNVGIGRELYDVPFIWVNLQSSEVEMGGKGKWQLKRNVSFSVYSVEYDTNRKLSKFSLVDNLGTIRYSFGEPISVAVCEKSIKDAKSLDELKSIWDKTPRDIKEKESIIKLKEEMKIKLSVPPADKVLEDKFNQAMQ